MADKYATRRFPVAALEERDLVVLDTLPYEYPGWRTEIELRTLEFTSICPWSGLPDFADLTIRYVPDKSLVEMKSLKYYLHSYRNIGILQEHAVNRIIEDLVALVDPLEITVEALFNARGGIGTRVMARRMKTAGGDGEGT